MTRFDRTMPPTTSVAAGVPHQRHEALGSQVILDLYECRTPYLDDLRWVEQTLVDAARAASATIVRTVFHKFAPWGISGVVVISESHLAIHIWPENRYVAIDIFTCGENVRIEVASDFLKRAFRAGHSRQRRFTRGDDLRAAARTGSCADYGRADLVGAGPCR